MRDLALGPASLNFLYRAIEPGFQAVAARDENYAYGWFNRVVDDPETTLLCRALPDPMGRYSQQEVPSRLLTYLGMRSTEAEIAIPGQIGGLYGNLQLTGQEHNSIDQPREMDYDPRTGDDRIKDFREVGAKVTLLPESGDIIATRLLDRDYLADWDRLRQIQIQWLRPLSETLSSEFRVEKYDRLRSFQDYATVPESHYRDAGYLNRFAWKVTGITKGGSVLQSDLDLRQGTYEKDLLFETADRVFDLPYNVGRLSFFVEKPLNWNTARGQVNIDLASEFTCLRGHANATPLAAGLGTSVVGMVKVSYPWTKFIRHETLLLGVSGPNEKHFPSNYLRSTWHNELLISPWGDGNCKLKVGYTRRPLNKENVYAAITGGSGFGNWSITVGKGTLWEFTETPYVLPGQYCRQEALLDPEIAGKPWQDWRNLNLARGSETTAQNLVVLRYWYSF